MTHNNVLDAMFFGVQVIGLFGIIAIVIVEVLLWKNKSRKKVL